MTYPPHFIPGRCANCDGPDVSLASPLYCSALCKQAAEIVGYVRSCRSDGRLERPDVREAIQIKMALVLGGGYDEERRKVPAGVRAEVFTRADGRCENCAISFVTDDPTSDAYPTIQHLAGSSNELANLAAWCKRCNNADARTHLRPVEPGSPQARLAADLEARWNAPTPLRLCDDEQNWKNIWRGLTNQARAHIEDAEALADAYGDEDPPGFVGRTIQEF